MFFKENHFKSYVKNYLWVIPFVSFLLGYLTIQLIFQPKSFKTPSIVGKNLQDAISILSKNQLNIKFIAEKEDSELPHGTILSQKPISGLAIRPNQSVYVTISKKPDKNQCPNLLNKKSEEISRILQNKKLQNRVYYLQSHHPKNSCIAQYPVPDSEIKNGIVTTYICNGQKKPVLFPDFKGKKLDRVLEFLKNNGIKAEVIDATGQYRKMDFLEKRAKMARLEQEKSENLALEQELAQNLAQQDGTIAPQEQDLQAPATGDKGQENKANLEPDEKQALNENSQEQSRVDDQLDQSADIEQEESLNDDDFDYSEGKELIVRDQRPLAGSIIIIDQSKPITVHLKVARQ